MISPTRITDASPASIAGLVESYARSFDATTFYPVRVQFDGLPPEEVDKWHRLGIAQKVYRALHNPGQELWVVRVHDGKGEREGRGVDERVPRDGPTPYDAELNDMPAQAQARGEFLHARSDALKAAAGGGYHLSWLGTVPKHRGRGMAGALVEYYTRFGFTIAGYDEWETDGNRFTWWVMIA
ncbi:hypothetical protein CcaverHIS002_0509440 [Cutaneotrichosporon cavernicola]|nr:hypothetical protein CcaverHIS002_0509440 [Cutaneotrichosporon cavernicola]